MFKYPHTDNVSATIVYVEKDIKYQIVAQIEELAFTRLHNTCARSQTDPRLNWYPSNLSGEEGPEIDLEPKCSADFNVLVNCTTCTIISLLWVFRCNDLWPVGPYTNDLLLGEVMSKLSMFDSRAWSWHGRKTKGGTPTMCEKCAASSLKIIAEVSRQAASSFNGLCLDCVRYRQRDDLKPYACRFKHQKSAKYLGLYDAAAHSRRS